MERNKIIQISFALIYNITFFYICFRPESQGSPEAGYMMVFYLGVFSIIAGFAFLYIRDKFPYDFSVNTKRLLLIFSTPLFPIILIFLLSFFSPVITFWTNR